MKNIPVDLQDKISDNILYASDLSKELGAGAGAGVASREAATTAAIVAAKYERLRQMPRSDRPSSYEEESVDADTTAWEDTAFELVGAIGQLQSPTVAGDDLRPRTEKEYKLFAGIATVSKEGRADVLRLTARARAGLTPAPSVDEMVSKKGSVERASECL